MPGVAPATRIGIVDVVALGRAARGTRARRRSASPSQTRATKSGVDLLVGRRSSGRARAARTRSPACSPSGPAVRWPSRPSTSFGIRSLFGWSAISASSRTASARRSECSSRCWPCRRSRSTKVRGGGGLGHAVREVAADGGDLGLRARVAGQHRQQPAERLERQLLDAARLAHERARAAGIAVAHAVADVERVRAAACGGRRRAVVRRDVPVDVRQVRARRARACAPGTAKPFAFARSSACATWMRDVRPRLVAAAPEREAAVVVLHAPAAARGRASTAADHLGRRRQALGLERGRARPQRGDRRARATRAARRTRTGRRRGRARRRSAPAAPSTRS